MQSFCVKWNNSATNDPCAICGARTDPAVGPEVFVEGTWALVCEECARKAAPAEAAIVRVFAERAELVELARLCDVIY